MLIRSLLTLVIATSICQAASAAEPVPMEIPYRGTLEQDGVPYEGTVTMTFALYDAYSNGSRVWGPNNVDVPVQNGKFSVNLSMDPQDTALLTHAELYLDVSVNGTALSGRQRLLTVPYARRCEDGVPFGAVMFFGATTCPAAAHCPDGSACTPGNTCSAMCPTGWEDYPEAQGRAVVGTPNPGADEATVGNPMGDQETPGHSHGVPAHHHAMGSTGGAAIGTTYEGHLCDGGFVQPAACTLSEGMFFSNLAPAYGVGMAAGGFAHTHANPEWTGDGIIVSTGADATATEETEAYMPYVQLRACIKK